jgi:hypothetical protein
MQQLVLANKEFPKILEGQKFSSVRRGRRELMLGPLLFASEEFGSDGKLLELEVDVTAVIHTTLDSAGIYMHPFTWRDVLADIHKGMLKYDPPLTDKDEVTVIFFKRKEDEEFKADGRQENSVDEFSQTTSHGF